MEWGLNSPAPCSPPLACEYGTVRSEERSNMLGGLFKRPPPPYPHRHDSNIKSHEEPIEERHRLQPPSGVERVCHGAGRFGKGTTFCATEGMLFNTGSPATRKRVERSIWTGESDLQA